MSAPTATSSISVGLTNFKGQNKGFLIPKYIYQKEIALLDQAEHGVLLLYAFAMFSSTIYLEGADWLRSCCVNYITHFHLTDVYNMCPF